MQDDRAQRVHVERVAHAPQNDEPAMLQTAAQIQIEGVVVAGHLDAAKRFDRQAGRTIRGSGSTREDEHPAVKDPRIEVVRHGQAPIDHTHRGNVEPVGQRACKANAQGIIDRDQRAADSGQAHPRARHHLRPGAGRPVNHIAQGLLHPGAERAAVQAPLNVGGLVAHAIQIELQGKGTPAGPHDAEHLMGVGHHAARHARDVDAHRLHRRLRRSRGGADDPAAHSQLFGDVHHHLPSRDARVPNLAGCLDVAAQHGHLARIEVEQLGRGLHVAGDVHLVGEEMRLVEELRALGCGCAGQTRVHLDCAGLLGIPQVHQVADVAAADLDAGKAIAQGRQITRRQVHGLHAALRFTRLQVVTAIDVFSGRAQVVLPNVLVRSQLERSRATHIVDATGKVHVVGRQGDFCACLEGGDHATGQRQQRIGAQQIHLQITLHHPYRVVTCRIGVGVAHEIVAPLGSTCCAGVVPVNRAFPAASPAGVAGVAEKAVPPRIFRADELFFDHQSQVVVFTNDGVSHAMGGSGQSHLGHAAKDRLGDCANGILGLDQHIGAFATDKAAVVVDQAAVGRLEPNPA